MHTARQQLREISSLLIMCLLVAVGAWASTQLSLAVGTVSYFWIADGVISAFILTAPRRWKIPLFIAGQLTSLGIDFAQGNSFHWACWFAVCNSLEVLVTVLPLRHFGGRAELMTKGAMLRIALFGLLLGPLLAAWLAAPVVKVIDHRPLLQALRIWFLADAFGSATTLPLLLFFFTRERRKQRSWGDRLSDVAWGSLLIAVVLAAFWQTKYPLLFLLFPTLVATLFRFRLAGAVYGTSIVVILAGVFTVSGRGAFVASQGAKPADRVILFQLFGLTMISSCVPLGFSVEERHRFESSLIQANEKLSRLALFDPLTGVHNRRGFDATMESEWSKACASGDDLSLIYLDLDFFKRFNDTYGHQWGDHCLQAVAQILVNSVRGMGDCVGRYGGEEFVILLPSTPAAPARAIAERITAAIVGLKIIHKESPFGVVTASSGLATVRPVNGGSTNRLIQKADSALYAAKQGGRGRVETSSEPSCLRLVPDKEASDDSGERKTAPALSRGLDVS